MALQDPNAPFAPWSVPPTADELDAAMASAYGTPSAQPQSFLDDVFAPIRVPTTVPVPAAPPAAPEPRKPDPIPYDPEEAAYHRAPPPTWDQDNGWRGANGDDPFAPPEAPKPIVAQKIGEFGGPARDEIAATGGQWLPTAAPELTPDAITGADPRTAQPPPGLNVAAAPGDFADAIGQGVNAVTGALRYTPPPPQDNRTPQMPDEYLSPEELGAAWSQLSPEEQEAKRSEIEGARLQQHQAGLISASTRALKDAEANAEDYAAAVKHAQTKQVELDAEAQKLANTKIDPLADISATQKIAGVFAAFLGGFAMAKTGRNVGLEQVDAMINDSLQKQTANLANQKDMLGKRQNAVAEQLALGKDLYQAQETVRLATYDQIVRQLETDAAQYDPRGTRALRMMDAINAIKSQRAEALGKYRKDELDRAERMLKEQREIAKLQEEQRHNMAQERADATRAGADWLRVKTDQKKAEKENEPDVPLSADELRARGINIPAGANVPPMSLKQAKQFAETAKSVEDWNKVARENSAEERDRVFAAGDIVDDHGDRVQFRNPEVASKMAKLAASSDLSVQLIDRLVAARQKYGWSSDLMKSPEWREMQSDFSQLILEKKNLDELGVIAGPDMDLMQKAIGTTDPTELRDPTPGLRRIRKTTIEKTNSVIRAEAALPKGRKVKRWDPPEPEPPPPATPDDIAFENLLKYRAVDDAETARYRASEGNATPRDGETPQAAAERAQRVMNELAPHIKKKIDGLAAAAVDPSKTDDQRKDAAAKLEQLAKSAQSPGIREYALHASTPDPAAGAQLSSD